MNKYRKGNITTMLLPIIFMILIAIIIAFIFVYVQVCIYLYDIKLKTFYIVKSSISKADYQNIVYRDYSLNENELKNNINHLFKENYEDKNKKIGIVNVECTQVTVVKSNIEVAKHTKNRYKVPVICVKYEVVFTPLISILGKELRTNMHDDIKLSLLEFN